MQTVVETKKREVVKFSTEERNQMWEAYLNRGTKSVDTIGRELAVVFSENRGFACSHSSVTFKIHEMKKNPSKYGFLDAKNQSAITQPVVSTTKSNTRVTAKGKIKTKGVGSGNYIRKPKEVKQSVAVVNKNSVSISITSITVEDKMLTITSHDMKINIPFKFMNINNNILSFEF